MNPYLAFRKLMPDEPLRVGEVLSHTGSGESLVGFPEGGNALVRGDSVAVGAMAYVKDSQIQGPAPDITPVEFSV